MQSHSRIFSDKASKLLSEYESYHERDDEIGSESHDYLMKFYKILSEYIEKETLIKLEELRYKCTSGKEVYELDKDIKWLHIHLQVGGYSEVSISLGERLKNINIVIENITFPNDDNLKYIRSEVFEILCMVNKIEFINCVFSCNSLRINNNTYFKKSRFKNKIFIEPFSINRFNDVYRYSNCTFYEDVCVMPSKENREIVCNLFEGCNFMNEIIAKNLLFRKSFIKFLDPINMVDTRDFSNRNSEVEKIIEHYNIDKLVIKNCIFENDVKINGFDKCYLQKLSFLGCNLQENYLKIEKLEIIDTKFESDFEIKYTSIGNFKFVNSNVEKIFDAFQSRLVKSIFIKSIFKDFAGFEEVEFGKKEKYSICYQTKFIYTTFKDFSNFRNTKFKSGLSFSSANLKQEPNFLNTDINLEATDRETLRIVKNSFEKVNNRIEANRFFTQEMKKYRKETRWRKNPFRKFILNANFIISGFGSNYIFPTLLLLASITTYVYLLTYQNEWVDKTLKLVGSIGGDRGVIYFSKVTYYANEGSKVIVPFNKLLESKQGFEFISLLFFIWFGILTWQIIVAVKRNTQH